MSGSCDGNRVSILLVADPSKPIQAMPSLDLDVSVSLRVRVYYAGGEAAAMTKVLPFQALNSA
jgi:hypothetical protein